MENPPPYYVSGQYDPSRPTPPAVPQEKSQQSQMEHKQPRQPMYQHPPQPMYQHGDQRMPAPQAVLPHTTTTIVMPQGQTVVATGNCPNCRVGFIHEEFSACGLIWAICCFPCGLICLLGMKDRKCINCKFEIE